MIGGYDKRLYILPFDHRHSYGAEVFGFIILGRGENEARVIKWLTTAAAVPGFIGFAVGRSSFLQSIVDLRAGKIDCGQAVRQIRDKFMEWVGVFDKAAG